MPAEGSPLNATGDVSADKTDAQDDDLDGGHNDNTTTIILRGHLFDSQLVNSVLDIVEEHKSVAHDVLPSVGYVCTSADRPATSWT
ncbi:hypothetical protein FOZ62_023102 [Perkinsus olseni]|uniref:Uncharacterized protein n=1 Tax=Perkinsus olseni TaxID=32597 RepID=A0A7J6Q3K5_PEROL|nr:hypothetical protein FOZ62_023102 [Perkinsus olseni]